jgi:hypothetical protein
MGNLNYCQNVCFPEHLKGQDENIRCKPSQQDVDSFLKDINPP